MNKIVILTLFFFAYLTGFSQTDTIFYKNQKISCKVIKIKTDSINYRLADSKVQYAIAKKEVDKIIYKNGKSFSIKDDISIKHVDGISNFNDVVITNSPADTSKCIFISNVEINVDKDQREQEKYREKAYQRLKILAALRGANIVFIPEYNAFNVSESNDTIGTTTLSGVAFCNDAPTIEDFDKIIGDKTEFDATEQWYLPKGKTDVYQLYFGGKFIINEIIESEGFVQINGELKGFPKITTFRLISISSKFFTISFEMNNTLYNVQVTL